MKVTVPESLQQLRDDFIEWVTKNLNVRVPMTRTINGKQLTEDITLKSDDVGADPAGSANSAKEQAISAAAEDATTKANNALKNSKSYTDSEISKEVTNRNSAISTAKQQAISAAAEDATEKANNALDQAKAYTDKKPNIDDNKVNYTDTWSSKKIDGVMSTLKSEAISEDVLNGKVNDALAEAKKYTDNEISEEVTARNSAISTAKKEAASTASADATTKANNALSEAKKYTDSEISKEVTNRNSAIATAKSEAISSANTYTDNAVSSIGLANGSTKGLVVGGGDVTIKNGVITVNDDSHNHVIDNIDGLQNTINNINTSISNIIADSKRVDPDVSLFSEFLDESDNYKEYWNRWCIVTTKVGTPLYNSPKESYDGEWWEVYTGGQANRGFQIAIGCYNHQRIIGIRYVHDSEWSRWERFITTSAFTYLDGKLTLNLD